MKKKKKYIKPITERISALPTSMLAVSPNKYTFHPNNGFRDATRGREYTGKTYSLGTTDDTPWGDDPGKIVESKTNPWGSWDE